MIAHGSRIQIRAATDADVATVLELINRFAEHVKLADYVEVTEDRLRETLLRDWAPSRRASQPSSGLAVRRWSGWVREVDSD